ncbi:MAG: hypothetical protein QXY40_00615 [Candidatus Methanomethylicia archaeon]
MSVQDVLEKIKVWFETGDENSNDIVEMPWEVEIERDANGGIKMITAINPRMPVRFHVFPLEKCIRIAVDMGLETAYLKPSSRIKVYRTALILNSAVEIMKFELVGLDDELWACADLSIQSINEGEFNDTIAALFIGLTTIVVKLGLEEKLKTSMFTTLIQMLKERIEKGFKPEDLLNFLTRRAGMDEKLARQLIMEASGRQPPIMYR